MRILVVEDEHKVARALKEGLEGDSYEVAVVHTGEEGFYLVNAETFDLIVLDLLLPGRSGLEILQQLRRRGLDTPVLILTAKDAVEDRVAGLDIRSEPTTPCSWRPASTRRTCRSRGSTANAFVWSSDDGDPIVKSRNVRGNPG